MRTCINLNNDNFHGSNDSDKNNQGVDNRQIWQENEMSEAFFFAKIYNFEKFSIKFIIRNFILKLRDQPKHLK